MRAAWLALGAALALCAYCAAQTPVVRVDFTDPGLSPSQWTLTLHPDGSGHFSSKMGKRPDGASKLSGEPKPDGAWEETEEIEAPDVNRDIQVSADFAADVFLSARSLNFFNTPCESHMKVAFEGWKTLSYSGPDGKGTCTFNYSKNKEVQELGTKLRAVAQTIVEGARLEQLRQHDPLGLDREMNYLVEAAGDGQAQQIGAIRGILERLAQDDGVMERVRKRARMLLAKAGR
jgi:hypothetical protein